MCKQKRSEGIVTNVVPLQGKLSINICFVFYKYYEGRNAFQIYGIYGNKFEIENLSEDLKIPE